MPVVVIRTSLSSADVRRAVAALPAALSGRASPADGRSLQLAMGVALLGCIKRSFLAKSAGGTDDAGERWAPLAPSTVARRRQGRGKGTAQILRNTGLLFNSLGPGAVDARPGEVAVGTNDPKAAWHHFGVPGRLPARRLWPRPEDFPARWWGKIGEALRGAMLTLLRRWLGGR